VLRVRDVSRSEAFYGDILGLSVTSRDLGMVFMSADGDRSHELALIEASANGTGPEPGAPGLAHFAWQAGSLDDLRLIRGRLSERGVTVTGVGSHGISIGVNFLDPDGNRVEIFYELPKEMWPDKGLFLGEFPWPL